jgi:hypothetical protein
VKYGNCLVGALYLLWKKRRTEPKFIYRHRANTKVPHFMVRTKDKLHHFNAERSILPWPFNHLLFIGQFQTVNISEEERYNK